MAKLIFAHPAYLSTVARAAGFLAKMAQRHIALLGSAKWRPIQMLQGRLRQSGLAPCRSGSFTTGLAQQPPNR